MSRYTKKQKTLDYILTEGSITSWEAIKEFGGTRLSAYIHSLRHKDELDIKTQTIKFVDRYGDKSHYARYYLAGSNYEKYLMTGGEGEYDKTKTYILKNELR